MIVFEPLTLYSQEENRVSECTGHTTMEMVIATILKAGMDDILLHELIFAVIYVKNLRLM